jgi:hypothetical protein
MDFLLPEQHKKDNNLRACATGTSLQKYSRESLPIHCSTMYSVKAFNETLDKKIIHCSETKTKKLKDQGVTVGSSLLRGKGAMGS